MAPTALGSRGFTLVELMIVVAIIGILAAIATPKFASLMRQTQEGATKGNMAALRSALNIYYGDMEGSYPTAMQALTVNGKYISQLPISNPANYHPAWNGETDVATGGGINDAGGWAYDNNGNDTNYGAVWVNCQHTDTKGSIWTAY